MLPEQRYSRSKGYAAEKTCPEAKDTNQVRTNICMKHSNRVKMIQITF
jgi:hypothetical protein